MKFISFLFLFIPSIVFSQNTIESTFTNPVWDGADPWMVKQGDDYIYCYTENLGIVVSKSKKMTQKGETQVIWQAPKQGWNRDCIWAPEIHFFKGHWYVYYAAAKSGPPFVHQRAGVLRSKTADVFSEYEDMGMLYTGDNPLAPETNVWAIDMTVFEHNQKLYAVWSGWEKQVDTDKTPQHLYVQEMKNPYTLKGKRVLISSPEEIWETGGPLNINEGPEILKNGKNVFIIYSCRESWTPEYRMGMLQLKSPEADPLVRGNWMKTGPVFEGNDKVFGVGHCSFVKSPDGNEDWIVYHAKKSKEHGWERDVRMQPFHWKDDETPDFGKAIPVGTPMKFPSGEKP
jgi:GH43 family beta-xylosidase